MQIRTFTHASLFALLLALSLSACGGDSSSAPAPAADPVPLTTTHALVAWNDLGMHCMDNDYSVFAILPPYNNLHAQLVDRRTGGLVTSGVTVTYEAVADTHGSIDTTVTGKTNFWDYVLKLFGASPAAGIGLAGNPAPGTSPAPLVHDNVLRIWKAEGIPVIPIDDAGQPNMYPMVRVVAKDLQGRVLAVTKTVLPVSTEMTCKGCHSSNVGGAVDALPAAGWVFDNNAGRDWRLNILRIHDDRNFAPANAAVYATALAWAGFDASGLENTVRLLAKPVLCAKCHPSNALGTAGAAGVKALTAAMHTHHAPVIEDATGLPLDAGNRTACYVCHPGSVTQCLRGTMGNAVDNLGAPRIQCQSCHGNLTAVGDIARRGWLDLPDCGGCHYQPAPAAAYLRGDNVYTSPGVVRASAGMFSSPGLYKLSASHGGIQCEACHGPTHAEYPCSEANDNVQATLLQGYAGKIGECGVCHVPIPLTKSGGPHGLHTIGPGWVAAHGSYARADLTYCAACHGADYRGTFLSAALNGRTFAIGGGRTRSYSRGQKISCYDCHGGPGGG
ncbi:MAG TPA: hypothetical protein VIU29_06395 [Candidatus Deferrimicrobiaceae bacterium]